MADIAEAANQAAEDAAFLAGAKFVIRTDLLPGSPSVPVSPTYQDLSAYIENDAGNLLAPNAASITFSNVTRDVTAYGYKDFGAAYFNDFSIDFEVMLTAGTANANVGIVKLTNALDQHEAIRASGGYMLGLLAGRTTSGFFIALSEVNAGTGYASSLYGLAQNANYFCTLSRSMSIGTYGTLTLKIYSDSTRSKLIATLNLALKSKQTYRYLMPVQSLDTNLVSASLTGKVANIVVR